jgi:oxygen-independent coproporphyrinogen-3 oxidase
MVEHLYVHIPFCHRVCPYCSFYKHTPGKTQSAAFIDALLTELDRHAEHLGPELAPRTIYLGGGTPSLLSTTHLAKLLGGLSERLETGRLEEWTLEANPATVDAAKARLVRQMGVGRVSLGVQSWDPEVLVTLGRDHSPGQARRTYEILREAGTGSVSIDLMFSVPGQSLASWEETLAVTTGLAPDHVSAYNLTYEEDTEFIERFRAGEFRRDEEGDGRFFDAAITALEADGFTHYETSNFARPGHESAHNWGYWRGEDYLGLGPGAVSTIRGERWTNLEDTAAYTRLTLAGQPTRTGVEALAPADLELERIALMLRTRTGLPLDLLGAAQRTAANDLIEDGLAAEVAGHLVLTGRGKHLADPAACHLAAAG